MKQKYKLFIILLILLSNCNLSKKDNFQNYVESKETKNLIKSFKEKTKKSLQKINKNKVEINERIWYYNQRLNYYKNKSSLKSKSIKAAIICSLCDVLIKYRDNLTIFIFTKNKDKYEVTSFLYPENWYPKNYKSNLNLNCKNDKFIINIDSLNFTLEKNDNPYDDFEGGVNEFKFKTSKKLILIGTFLELKKEMIYKDLDKIKIEISDFNFYGSRRKLNLDLGKRIVKIVNKSNFNN